MLSACYRARLACFAIALMSPCAHPKQTGRRAYCQAHRLQYHSPVHRAYHLVRLSVFLAVVLFDVSKLSRFQAVKSLAAYLPTLLLSQVHQSRMAAASAAATAGVASSAASKTVSGGMRGGGSGANLKSFQVSLGSSATASTMSKRIQNMLTLLSLPSSLSVPRLNGSSRTRTSRWRSACQTVSTIWIPF